MELLIVKNGNKNNRKILPI